MVQRYVILRISDRKFYSDNGWVDRPDSARELMGAEAEGILQQLGDADGYEAIKSFESANECRES